MDNKAESDGIAAVSATGWDLRRLKRLKLIFARDPSLRSDTLRVAVES